MKEDLEKVKKDVKAKLLFWQNIESKKVKAALILALIALVGLKIFTTVLTFDWLASLFS